MADKGPPGVTQLLQEWSAGDPHALGTLMPMVADELREMAGKIFDGEATEHTLQPTALVNEVYLRLVERRKVSWDHRSQFFAFAAQLMRRILVDHARRRRRAKRGGGVARLPLDESLLPQDRAPELLALDEALDGLSKLDARQARVVELRYFSGLSVDEIAEVLGVSSRTVKRDWRTALAWLRRELGSTEDE